MPPMTPATSPTGAESRRSRPGEIFGAKRARSRTTNPRTNAPRISVTARAESMTRSFVPTIVPTMVKTSSGASRRGASPRGPCRRSWRPSITRFGMTSTATAVFTSTTRASSGVPSVGNPKPIAPLTKAAARTAAAVPGLARERLSQNFGRVLGPATGQVLDLLTTGDAGRDDLGLQPGGLHGGGQPAVAERDPDVVVLPLEAERASHAAAARNHFPDPATP